MTAEEKNLDAENKRLIIQQALLNKKKADIFTSAQDTAEELTSRLVAKGANISPKHLTPVLTSLLVSSKDSPIAVSKDPAKPLLTAGQLERVVSALSDHTGGTASPKALKSELRKLTANSVS